MHQPVLTMQGITKISVQSSVSLQHLPVDKTIEKGLPSSLLNRLSFATQKLDEVLVLLHNAHEDEVVRAVLPTCGREQYL